MSRNRSIGPYMHTKKYSKKYQSKKIKKKIEAIFKAGVKKVR
jgi:hypothetical protein